MNAYFKLSGGKRFFAAFLALLLTLALTPFRGFASEEGQVVLPPDPDILAQGALLVDLKTGKMVYGKNEHAELFPASLTKVMTALLTLEAIDTGRLTFQQEVTAGSVVKTLPADGSTVGLKEGEVMTVRNLLDCLLIPSANEAACVLAVAVAGSVDAFVDAMNKKADELGCRNTHFVNPHGLHDPGHYTSPWDMYLITKAAMKYPTFMVICDTDRVVVPATNMSKERALLNTNYLICNRRIPDYKNPEVHGVKTGSTSQSGHCLVATAQRNNKHFLSVVMGAERVQEGKKTIIRSFSETTRLFNWGFDNFRYMTLLDEGEPIDEIPVSLSRTNHVTAVSGAELEALVPAGLKKDVVERSIQLETDSIEAPVEEGQKLGTVTVSYNGVEYGSVDLLSSHAAELSKFLQVEKKAVEIAKKPVTWAAAGVVGVAALALAIRGAIKNRRRARSSGFSGYNGR
ncbi:MAG: D-alanyl-D-alanine carboxypeptidase [Oscillibacter sp.]|nr:D-alanyl-D-alanine carboxypeptidase [Oscillibacter sp.]